MRDLEISTAVLRAEFLRSGIAELHIEQRDFEIYLSNSSEPKRCDRAKKQPSPPAIDTHNTAATSVAPLIAADAVLDVLGLPANAHIVTAPNLGTFYRAPKPGSASYVEIGGAVGIGDELCLIEVMKLFTAVRADTAGRLHAVLAEDGSMVEAGQPLFALVSE